MIRFISVFLVLLLTSTLWGEDFEGYYIPDSNSVDRYINNPFVRDSIYCVEKTTQGYVIKNISLNPKTLEISDTKDPWDQRVITVDSDSISVDVMDVHFKIPFSDAYFYAGDPNNYLWFSVISSSKRIVTWSADTTNLESKKRLLVSVEIVGKNIIVTKLLNFKHVNKKEAQVFLIDEFIQKAKDENRN